MRYLFCISFIFISTTILYGTTFLDGIHGLKNEKGEMLFEVSGYTISVYEVKGSVDDEGTLRLVEKAYGLDHILMTYTDSTLNMKNKIIEGLIDALGLPVQISQKCILLQKENEIITVLYLETSIKRDFVLEEEIVQACIDGQLSKYASEGKTAFSMTLAGKKIDLPYGAEWVTPNRIVKENALVNWSEFSSASRANQYLSNQINIDKAERLEYIKENEIDVLFDGKPVMARRFVFRDPSSGSVSNYMITYYLVCELRGRYVACILSYYGYASDDFYLPALLESVMQITSISRQMYSSFSEKKDEVRPVSNLTGENDGYLIEFQFGAILPSGNLRNVYNIAPSMGMYFGFPVGKRMGIDIGAQFAFPINSSFDYYWGGSTPDEAEAVWLGGLSVRWRYQMGQSKKLSYFSYLGLGAIWLTTDIEDEYDWESDSYSYNSVATVDVFSGFNIRYKKIGLFVEYHFTPYAISDKVKDNFGHSSFNVGISFVGFRW